MTGKTDFDLEYLFEECSRFLVKRPTNASSDQTPRIICLRLLIFVFHLHSSVEVGSFFCVQVMSNQSDLVVVYFATTFFSLSALVANEPRRLAGVSVGAKALLRLLACNSGSSLMLFPRWAALTRSGFSSFSMA